MTCACGCDLSIAMIDVLRALDASTMGGFRPLQSPYEIKGSRDVGRRSVRSIRNSLRGLANRGLVRGPDSFDSWRITDRGELWCKEHRE